MRCQDSRRAHRATGGAGRPGRCCVRPARLAAGAVAVSLLGAALAGAPAVAGDVTSLALAYRGTLGYLPVLDAVAVLDLGDQRYDMRVELTAVPMFARVFQGSLRADADGALEADRPVPDGYRMVNRAGDREARVRLDREAGRLTRREPAPRDPEAARARTGEAVDPVSAFLLIMLRQAADGTCPDRLSVFDGFRRLEVRVREGARTEIRAPEAVAYAGPVRECAFAVTGADGGPLDPGDPLSFLGTGYLLLAPAVEGGPPVPVFAEAGQGLGAGRLTLVRAEPVDPTLTGGAEADTGLEVPPSATTE